MEDHSVKLTINFPSRVIFTRTMVGHIGNQRVNVERKRCVPAGSLLVEEFSQPFDRWPL